MKQTLKILFYYVIDMSKLKQIEPTKNRGQKGPSQVVGMYCTHSGQSIQNISRAE